MEEQTVLLWQAIKELGQEMTSMKLEMTSRKKEMKDYKDGLFLSEL